MTIYYDHLQQPIEKPDDVPVKWRPCIYGILSNEKGEWFLVEPTWAKQWDLPGGGADSDESIREALVREFYEETGINPMSIKEEDVHPIYWPFIKRWQRENS